MGAHLAQVIKDKDDLFLTGKYKIVTDCVREWAILLFGIFVIIYFSICAYRIYRTTGVLTFDSAMILIEAFKVRNFSLKLHF